MRIWREQPQRSQPRPLGDVQGGALEDHVQRHRVPCQRHMEFAQRGPRRRGRDAAVLRLQAMPGDDDVGGSFILLLTGPHAPCYRTSSNSLAVTNSRGASTLTQSSRKSVSWALTRVQCQLNSFVGAVSFCPKLPPRSFFRSSPRYRPECRPKGYIELRKNRPKTC